MPRTRRTARASRTRKAKGKSASKISKSYNKCMRCERAFASRAALKKHIRMHMQAIHEIKMLEQGFVPVESKIGSDFKGKNKIIVS